MSLEVLPVSARDASRLVVEHHYLHRRPPISFAFGLINHVVHQYRPITDPNDEGAAIEDVRATVGVVTFGVPPSRHLQQSACPSNPDLVLELNRLWVEDEQPRNTESWFLARVLRLLPPRIIVSYADTKQGHLGYIYRASNFHYAGWTDMERKTPRFDYLPADPQTHTRDAFRNGYVAKVRRKPKVKYWTTTGNRTDRRRLEAVCPWPSMDWNVNPPPLVVALRGTTEEHGN